MVAASGTPPGEAPDLPFPDDPDLCPEIKAERIARLLPEAMARSDVDAWIVLAR